MILGLGQSYGPTDLQLGIPDPSLVSGQFPFGSIGDQWQTCVAAGGDAQSCSEAVVSTNLTAGGVATPAMKPKTDSNKTMLLAALVFLGVVVMRTR